MFHKGRKCSDSTTADRAPTSEVTSLFFSYCKYMSLKKKKKEGQSNGDLVALLFKWTVL